MSQAQGAVNRASGSAGTAPAGPSNLAQQRAQQTAGGQAPSRLRAPVPVVDLTLTDSDDEDVLVVGTKGRPAAPPQRQTPTRKRQRTDSGGAGSTQNAAMTHAQAMIEAAQAAAKPPVAPPSPPGPKCMLCLERMEAMASTPCGHVACPGCLQDCIKATRKCPNCRKGVTLKQIHRIYL